MTGHGRRSKECKEWRQELEADHPQSARLDEVGMARSNRVAVDAFGRDLLASAPLQRLVDAHDQWSSWHERLDEQPEQYPACLSARPRGAAQDPMVAAEAPLFLHTHRSEGGSYGPLSRSQDRTRQERLNMRPDAFGEKWHEGCQRLYHRSR